MFVKREKTIHLTCATYPQQVKSVDNSVIILLPNSGIKSLFILLYLVEVKKERSSR